MAPASAEPATMEGITRSGSAAAKGIAPSVMKAAPSTAAAPPASRSGAVKRDGNRRVASAIPSGGVMPPSITAAIGASTPEESSAAEEA